MKKTIIIIAVMLGFAFAASAQPKAIGGRLGYGIEASSQHTLGAPHFLELNAGIFGLNHVGFRFTGLYNFVFAQPNWTPRGSWAWYAGPGVSLGTAHYNDKNGQFFAGIAGQLGLEYEFWFPLQLSVDLRPQFGFCDGEFYMDGVTYGFVPTLSVRYAF